MLDRSKAPALQVRVNPESGALDLLDAAGESGWRGLAFYLEGPDGPMTASGARQVHQEGETTGWISDLAEGVEARFEVRRSAAGHGAHLRVWITNGRSAPLGFVNYGFGVVEGAAGPRLSGTGLPVYAHSENLRYEQLPLSQPTFPFVRPFPENGRWYGRQGVGPMPALVIGRAGQDRWLVEGAASQRRHAPSWRLELPSAGGRMLDYRSGYFWNGASTEQVPAGETVELEGTLYLLVEASPDQFYEAYVEELSALYGDRFAGRKSRLAEHPVYCSWNYGVFTGITEEDCLKRIVIAGETQRGGIFQLDHGYQPPYGSHLSWGYMDAYYPDTSATWDRERFPGGPKRFVEECRKHGLVPAIWWTPRMDIGGPISREHPEWIAHNNGGEPIPFVGDLHPDYSVPEVRAFIERTLRTVIQEWGFEGIKLDFFSWAFDSPDVVYRNGGTSVQWRRWLIELVRELIGPEGYFLHCVSCPLGNPFLALDGCDSFRAGSDIDRGDWAHHVDNSSWLLASMTASGRRTWFADMDSFMGAPEFPGNERRFRNAVGYLTGGMIDISGPLEKYDASMLREYRLLSERCDQGTGVRVPDRQAFYGRPLSRVLARVHGPGSKTREKFGALATVGLFNWDPVATDVRFDVSDLELESDSLQARDFWSGERVALDGGVLTVRLAPREHLLVDLLAGGK